MNERELRDRIFNTNEQDFMSLACAVFLKQYHENAVYREYCDLLKIDPDRVVTSGRFPFLPIHFFKSRKVISGNVVPEVVFESSGTTGSVNSKHYVKDPGWYEESFVKGFKYFYGNIENYCILGLLPSYLERKNASLVYMVDQLIQMSGHEKSGFYLHDTNKLYETVLQNEKSAQQTLLVGVTFALLDFAEQFQMNLKHTIIMETGGMKGRKKELTRDEIHQSLQNRLGVTGIHAEYGMTELLSQAYARSAGRFHCPPWMQVHIRAEDDPFDIRHTDNMDSGYTSGCINIIDLANRYSCSFIATDDIGRLYKDGSFEVLGRMDNSDIRGCSLMVV